MLGFQEETIWNNIYSLLELFIFYKNIATISYRDSIGLHWIVQLLETTKLLWYHVESFITRIQNKS